MERNVCFILDVGNGVERVGCGIQPKVQLPPPHWQPVGKISFLYGGRGAPWRNSTVSSDNHLEINWSSDQHHLNCFQCCLSSVPGLDGSHIPKANSQNHGSCCHGYSLVIMSLTFSTWWGFQSLQDSSQDMAQNIVHRPWGGTKGPGLCLVTKLVLFGLLWLSSFVSASSHFSELIPWLKFPPRRQVEAEVGTGRTIGSCSVSNLYSINIRLMTEMGEVYRLQRTRDQISG